MAEYINRKSAIDIVARWFKEINLNGDICIDGLRSFPAADVVERKTGKWIHDTLGYIKMPTVKCSECGLKEVWNEDAGMGFALHGQKYANFCPNCGAKMEG